MKVYATKHKLFVSFSFLFFFPFLATPEWMHDTSVEYSPSSRVSLFSPHLAPFAANLFSVTGRRQATHTGGRIRHMPTASPTGEAVALQIWWQELLRFASLFSLCVSLSGCTAGKMLQGWPAWIVCKVLGEQCNFCLFIYCTFGFFLYALADGDQSSFLFAEECVQCVQEEDAEGLPEKRSAALGRNSTAQECEKL